MARIITSSSCNDPAEALIKELEWSTVKATIRSEEAKLTFKLVLFCLKEVQNSGQ